MRFKVCAFIMLAALIGFSAWACFTWPVEESVSVWTDDSHAEADVASLQSVERSPMPAEVAMRAIMCAGSLIVGIKLVRVFQSKKPD